MSYILPLATGTFSGAQATRNLLYSCPIAINENKRTDITNELSTYLNKLKITKITIYTDPDTPIISSNGSNLNASSISVSEKLWKIDKDACHFLIKREISHINHNDTIGIHFLSSATQLTLGFASRHFQLTYRSTLPLLVTSFALPFFCTRSSEIRTDDEAIQGATDDELKGGLRYFSVIAELDKDDGIAPPTNLPIDQRIEKIRKELSTRNIEYNSKDLEPLTEFIQQNSSFFS